MVAEALLLFGRIRACPQLRITDPGRGFDCGAFPLQPFARLLSQLCVGGVARGAGHEAIFVAIRTPAHKGAG